MRACFLVLVGVATLAGCASAPRDTRGFAAVDTIMVDAPLLEAWQVTKRLLLEREYHIQTRDKRGLLVAYVQPTRRLRSSRRTQYTFLFSSVSERETEIRLEALDHRYGVTLLTNPGWHALQTSPSGSSTEMLEEVKTRLTHISPVAGPSAG